MGNPLKVASNGALVLCDYHPALLDSLIQTLDEVPLPTRVFLRKRHDARWGGSREKVITLPLPVTWEERKPSPTAALSLVAYLVLGVLIGVIAVVRKRLRIVLGVYSFPQACVAYIIGKITNRKTVILTDGGDIDVLLRKPVIREMILGSLRNADVATSLSEAKRNRLLDLGVNTHVCPVFGVNTSQFSFTAAEEKDWNEILFVGRLSDEKSPDVLLRAFSALERRSIQLLIIGSGPLDVQLRKHMGSLGLSDRVTFKDHVPHSQISEFFHRSAIFVLPSRREGVSVALLEAMASGCVCIVSNIPDNTEIIRDGRNGITFLVNDYMDLKRKISWALSHKQEAAQLGLKARSETEKKYSNQAIARTLRQFFS